jgi:hypothetical protein
MSDQNRPPSDEEDWGPSSPWRQQPPEEQPPQQPPPQQPPPHQPPPQQGFQQHGFQQQGFQQYPPQQYPPQQPFQQQPSYRPPAQIQNYLVWAIISVVLCIPTGVVALVFSTQVNSKLSTGDVAGATKASNNAKIWCIVSTGLGVLGIVAYLASVGSAA